MIDILRQQAFSATPADITLMPGTIQMEVPNAQLPVGTVLRGVGNLPSDTIVVCNGFSFAQTAAISVINLQFENGATSGVSYFRISNGAISVFDRVHFGNHSGSLDNGAITLQGNSDLFVTDCLFDRISSSRSQSNALAISIQGPSNVTIRNSVFNGISSRGNGGAISSNNAVMLVENCTFTNNLALNGGAIRAETTTITIRNSRFFNNQAFGGSGALALINSRQAMIVNNIFGAGNDGLIGGANAIACAPEGSSELNITDCIFEDMISSTILDGGTSSAGAILTSCTMNVERTSFRRLSTGFDGFGSAIQQDRGSLTVIESEFVDLIGRGAVAFFSSDASLTFQDTTFTNTFPKAILVDSARVITTFRGTVTTPSVSINGFDMQTNILSDFFWFMLFKSF